MNQNNGRVIEIRNSDGGWDRINFSDLKDGNQFRMIDNGNLVVCDGKTNWIAKGRPYSHPKLKMLAIQTQ